MKRTAAMLARAGLALAVIGSAAQCEKPVALNERMESLADVPGGGRIYFDSILVPPSTTALIGSIYERSIVWGDLTTNRLVHTIWSGDFRATEAAPFSSARPVMVNIAVKARKGAVTRFPPEPHQTG